MCHALLLAFVVNLWRKPGEREDELAWTGAKAETGSWWPSRPPRWPHSWRLPTSSWEALTLASASCAQEWIWKLNKNRIRKQTTTGRSEAVLKVTSPRNKYRNVRVHCQATWNSVLFYTLAAFPTRLGSKWPSAISKYWNQSLRARRCCHWATSSVKEGR